MIILLSVEDLTRMVPVATPIDATMNVVERFERAPNVSTMRLVDFLVGVRVGIARWLPSVYEDVASRPPLEIGATTWMIGTSPP